jgi:hypothetical protein
VVIKDRLEQYISLSTFFFFFFIEDQMMTYLFNFNCLQNVSICILYYFLLFIDFYCLISIHIQGSLGAFVWN